MQDVDCAEKFQLKGTVVPHAPDTDGDGDDGDEDERNKHLNKTGVIFFLPLICEKIIITKTQRCLRDSRLSATSSSNIRSRRWVARLMSMALYWRYSSACNLLCGRLHQTHDPTIAPKTKDKK